MPDVFEFTLSGDQPLKRKMTKSGVAIADLRDPLKRFTLWIRRDVITKSRAGTDVEGRSFAALSENTIAGKREKGQPPAPLIATGKMLQLRTIRYRVKTQMARLWVPEKVKEAYYAQFGMKARLIAAVKARFLRFFTVDGWQFAKSVDHPGRKPRPWFGARPGSERVLKREVQLYLKRQIASR